MASRIFEVIQPDFFRILSNASKFEYAECLGLLYESLTDSNEYTLPRQEASLILQHYFDSVRDLTDESLVQTSRERANYFLREMKETGWLEEEIGKNYQVMLSLSETAVQFLIFVDTLKYDTELKYSSQIYSIYHSLKTFDAEKGELVIEEAYKNTLSFFDSLRRLNTSIKKYIQRIFDENITNNLNELFKILTGEYQLKIVDAAYYHLLTKDNPSQYSLTIIDHVELILSDYDLMNQMVSRLSKNDEEYEKNYKDIQMKLAYIREKFLTIQELIHEITIKNQSFVSSAIGRIQFLLNETTDVTGLINEVIKKLVQYPDFEIEGLLSDVNIIDDTSIATPRKRTIKEKSYISELGEDNKDIHDIQSRLIELSKYSKKQIETIVNEIIGHHEKVSISDYDFLNITMITLIFLYGYSYNSTYKIERTSDTYIKDGRVLGNYFIRRTHHE